jgi:hypothetical protein
MRGERLLYVKHPGPRPAFHLVAEHLWGVGCNFDSDGDSKAPLDSEWTELTIALRGGTPDERISIDPVSLTPLVLVVRSANNSLCERAAQFVASRSGGSVEKTA